MPCFMAGMNAASVIGTALNVPVYGFSHQEGHAAAILESGGREAPAESVFFHLSGGTTEALLCRPDLQGYSMEIAGGTLDISIGQLIDRFGVAMGYPFPSGKYLDDVAFGRLENHGSDASLMPASRVMPDIRIREGYFNLSGAETRLMQFAGSNEREIDAGSVTAELFIAIASLLRNEASYLSEKFGIKDIYMAGGVASSRTVRRILQDNADPVIMWGDAQLSGDNAVGTALLAKRIHETGKR